jgi:hypothetical protein
MWGYLHRVPAGRLTEMLANPSEINEALYPSTDEPKRLPECTVEKSWHAIEFILDRLIASGRIPYVSPLVGGAETGTGFHYGACWYRTPEEVRDVAGALAGLSKTDFRNGYDPARMHEEGVYPNIWDEPDAEANFEYVWAWFKDMVEFYQQAAQAGEGMLLHWG